MFKENCTQYCETCLEYKNPEHCEDNVYVLADKIMDIINPLRRLK